MNNEDLLKEILLTPSSEIQSERFSEEAEGAACGGNCHSGTCRGVAT